MNAADMSLVAFRHVRDRLPGVLAILLLAAAVVPGLALGDQPGRGITRPFEIDYLKFIIDHHFAALRMTEVAAGTDPNRDAAISAHEGTSPTPGFSASADKAQLEEITATRSATSVVLFQDALCSPRTSRMEHETDVVLAGECVIRREGDAGTANDSAFSRRWTSSARRLASRSTWS